ncbi:hypothetical protein TH606_05635 [Thermodesulfatator autotrophicus]|uniref:Glycosyl transferase family 1 domain-containing protein n=2 Tax=Thermodesulfatator autotrophicus TaxID=1795632 RepID=A0A177E7B2_9BACT|nr:hypothetical protein TH606_05635 [Thermodesulfatator autotrophicus]
MAKTLKELGVEVELISGNGTIIKYSQLNLKTFPFKPREKFPDFGNRFRKLLERLSFLKSSKLYLENSFFDVLLIFKPFDFVATYFVKKRNPKCLTVFISGGEDFWHFDRFFLKSVDLVISVSKENARLLKKRYRKEAIIIPNGVDVNKFKPYKEERKRLRENFKIEEKKVLLSVGRIVGWKGYQLVIKALKNLPSEYVYVLIGDGPYLKDLKLLAKSLGVEKRVFFLGAKEHNELPRFYSIGDVFVQPSVGHEAFGITVIEAMACGLPVVGSTSGGIKELIEDGFNGFLFEKGNLKDLTEKIQTVFKCKNIFKNNPRRFVKENYSWQILGKRLLNTLEERIREKR